MSISPIKERINRARALLELCELLEAVTEHDEFKEKLIVTLKAAIKKDLEELLNQKQA